MAYRVDNVPVLWRPFWLAYSWALGIGQWLLFLALNATCRIEIERSSGFIERDGLIFCLWHESWFLWFVAFVRSSRGQAWLQHPAAYMKPVHIALRLMGVRVLLGSGGEEGREATATLIRLLKDGRSTVISPDGPHGPPRTLKKGVLHVALDSGAPVVPVRLTANRTVRLPTWDRKPAPLPFATICIVLGAPVFVTTSTFEESRERLAAGMSG